MTSFTGPLFYVTERNGEIVHQPREVAAGSIVCGSGHAITAATLPALIAEVSARGMVMPRLPWRDRIRAVWQSASSELKNDPALALLASVIGELNSIPQIRAVIMTSKAANSENQAAVNLADSLLAELE